MKKKSMVPMATEIISGMGLAPCSGGGGDGGGGGGGGGSGAGGGVEEESGGVMGFLWVLWRGWKRRDL